MQNKQLILASNSPRRQQILANEGFLFEVIVSDYEEVGFSSDPELTATTFAKAKANDVFNKLVDKTNKIVVGADTVVFCNGQILGKPKDKEQAYDMLKTLSGITHSVATGFCIKSQEQEIVGVDTTLVTFNELTEQDIKNYINSGLYKGKAGAYGIQDKDYNLVKGYRGSLNNVIGFPTEKIIPLLKKLIEG